MPSKDGMLGGRGIAFLWVGVGGVAAGTFTAAPNEIIEAKVEGAWASFRQGCILSAVTP